MIAIIDNFQVMTLGTKMSVTSKVEYCYYTCWIVNYLVFTGRYLRVCR